MKTRLLPLLFFLTLICSPPFAGAATSVKVWGNTEATNVPPWLTNATAISRDSGGCLALTSQGSVVGWGPGWGPGSIVPGCESGIVSISPGAAVRTDGTVVDFGANLPIGLTNVAALAPGAALLKDGTAFSWGFVSFNTMTGYVSLPLLPAGLSNVSKIATGGTMAGVLLSNGTVVVGGAYINYIVPGIYPITTSPSWTNVVDIGVGGTHISAVTADGTVLTAGYDPFTWSRAPLLETVVSISVTGGADMGLLADGSVVSWCQDRGKFYTDCLGQVVPGPPMPYAKAICIGPGYSMALIDPDHALTPPRIFRQPNSQTAQQHGSATFHVLASSSAPEIPLTYQWFFGADPIANATNASLVLTDLHASQSGAYSVRITNANLSTNSTPAMLSVVPLIDIKVVPALYLTGDVGSTYRLEFVPAVGPTNAWTTLTNLTLLTDPHIYFDLSAIGQPARFYRLSQLP